MVASTYVEFLFWRKMRYRQGRLENFGDIAGQLPEMEENNMAIYDTDSPLVKFFRDCFEGRRKYFVLFSVVLTIEFCVLVTQEQRIRIFWDSSIVDVMMAIILIVFRAVFAKRLHQFVQWKFWAGMVLGFITGPIYLLMHTFESVRKSDKWEVIADGCNVGFGFLALIFIFCWHIFSPSKNMSGLCSYSYGFSPFLVFLHVLFGASRPIDKCGVLVVMRLWLDYCMALLGYCLGDAFQNAQSTNGYDETFSDASSTGLSFGSLSLLLLHATYKITARHRNFKAAKYYWRKWRDKLLRHTRNMTLCVLRWMNCIYQVISNAVETWLSSSFAFINCQQFMTTVPCRRPQVGFTKIPNFIQIM